MTRKDYVAIADAIKCDATEENQKARVRQIIVRLADVFERDNNRFDRNRFFNYCKI